MRGTVAKKLRKQVYGDYSHRNRDYKEKSRPNINPFDKILDMVTGTIYCTGRRKEYQELKKQHKNH